MEEDKSTHETKTLTQRQRRLAAGKFMNKMKDLLPCLNIKIDNPLSPHGWNYEDWLSYFEEDPYQENIVDVFNNNYVLKETVSIRSIRNSISGRPMWCQVPILNS